MTIFVLLHGWKMDPRRMDSRWRISETLGGAGIEVLMPTPPTLHRRGWRASDAVWVAEYVRNYHTGRMLLGGFSDGARTALLASFLVQVDGLIFHSGVYVESEIAHLSARTLAPWGRRDWTAKVPFWGTNAAEFWEEYRDDTDMARFVHPGGHEWGEGTNEAIIAEFGGNHDMASVP